MKRASTSVSTENPFSSKMVSSDKVSHMQHGNSNTFGKLLTAFVSNLCHFSPRVAVTHPSTSRKAVYTLPFFCCFGLCPCCFLRSENRGTADDSLNVQY